MTLHAIKWLFSEFFTVYAKQQNILHELHCYISCIESNIWHGRLHVFFPSLGVLLCDHCNCMSYPHFDFLKVLAESFLGVPFGNKIEVNNSVSVL